MSVATDTARVGSLAGSPTLKRLGAAFATVALAASIVGASSLLTPNPQPAPEAAVVSDAARQAMINAKAVPNVVPGGPPVGHHPGISGGPGLPASTAIPAVTGSIAGGVIPNLPVPTGPVMDTAPGATTFPGYLAVIEEAAARAQAGWFDQPYTESPMSLTTPKPFGERPGSPK